MSVLDQMAIARDGYAPRILFTDGYDPRVLAAAQELVALAAARPILFGEREGVAAHAKREGLSLDGIEVIDPAALPDLDRYVASLAARRALAPAVAKAFLARPLHAALALLGDGVADFLVAGVTSHTADVLIACDMWLARRAGCTTASAAFVMDIRGRPLVFADCAVTPSPTAEQLAEIAIQTAATAHALLRVVPRVAMLSFSTHGSATHPDVERVAQATSLVRARRPELDVDGELQADAALDPVIAGQKLDGALPSVAGRANVLVFPDLDAANIGYKLVRTLASVSAYGVFVQGYDRTVVKLSRGSTTDEIVGTCLLLRAYREVCAE